MLVCDVHSALKKAGTGAGAALTRTARAKVVVAVKRRVKFISILMCEVSV
jgi:hypothetical protein